jgi:glyoxylase-like metal-dependent hydrolase (beta-lactamase superfamily II)
MEVAMTMTITRRGALGAGLGAGLGGAAALAFGVGRAQAEAAMMGPLTPAARRFPLGGFEVTTILDGAVSVPGPHPIFGEDQSAEIVAEAARQAMLPADNLQIGFTVTLVNTGSELILFDAGNGAGRRPNAGLLLERLAAAGYAPEQIDIVALTHFHGDHIGGLMENGAPAFPNARYVCGAAEFDHWTAIDNATDLILSNIEPLAEQMTMIAPGDAVVSGVEAVDSSGHTPGHLCYHLENEGKRLLVFGDVANHYALSLQRPEWHVRFDMDKEKAVATRKRILDMLAVDRIPFIGYHMPTPGVGYVRAEGDAFRFIPETYQLAF